MAALAGCQSSPPRDCNQAEKQALQCMERNHGKDGRELLLACFPFSQPERIAGSWAMGFELNAFHEGKRPAASLAFEGSDTELEIAPEKETAESLDDGLPKLFEVEFVGRRSQCDMGIPRHIIVVDRLVLRREFKLR